jgi:hypothetical protein
MMLSWTNSCRRSIRVIAHVYPLYHVNFTGIYAIKVSYCKKIRKQIFKHLRGISKSIISSFFCCMSTHIGSTKSNKDISFRSIVRLSISVWRKPLVPVFPLRSQDALNSASAMTSSWCLPPEQSKTNVETHYTLGTMTLQYIITSLDPPSQ